MLTTERSGGVLVATLARTPVNAIDAAVLAHLEAALRQAEADETVTVFHLRSGLPVFCPGADLALMRECLAQAGAAHAMVDVVIGMQRVFARLASAPFVSIAEIGGAAFGGGLELALACDLRVAAHEAKLALPEASLGLLPAAGGTQRLTALCGPGVARRLILGGETIDGREAERLGVVDWARPADALTEWTAELAARIAAKPRAALAANKRCIAAAVFASPAGFAAEIDATRELYGAPYTLERVGEFLARRRTTEAKTKESMS
ncbi:MAG: enoyl-CoA hydratase/isomerase family protein [Burkholderiales bacterium]|nr:enoyl-CoA hydratase/isomerase family protein [Burkholderiales bacterium]